MFPFVLEDKSKESDFAVGKPLWNDNVEIGKIVKFDRPTGIGQALISYLDMEPFGE